MACDPGAAPFIPPQPENAPIEESHRLKALYYQGAYLKAFIRAPRYRRYGPTDEHDAYVEFPEGILILFYDSVSGAVEAQVRARYARRWLSRRRSELRHEVLVVNPKGDSLLTEQLFWDENTQRLYSSRPVRVITASETILAEGFESDVALDSIVFHRIRGYVRVRDSL